MPERQPLSNDEVVLLESLLSRVEPGWLDFRLFKQMARINRLSIVDLVSFYVPSDEEMKVFLTRRPHDDHFWPNMLDIPGTVVLATDENTFDAPLTRLLSKEMGNPEIKGEFIYVRSQMQNGERGTETATSFAIELASVPTVGELYSLKKLPDLSLHQMSLITSAANRFKEVKNIK